MAGKEIKYGLRAKEKMMKGVDIPAEAVFHEWIFIG
jgi:hypothetical protein